MTVNIVGRHPSLATDFSLPGEFWGCNHVEDGEDLSRFSRWYHLHTRTHMMKRAPEQWAEVLAFWSTERGLPLYLPEVIKMLPDSVEFPRERVEAIGPRGGYHITSADWMLCHAIADGAAAINLHRVALSSGPVYNREPLSGRPCLEYWCGFAEGRGITVTQVGPSEHFHAVHMARIVHGEPYGYGIEPGFELQEHWPGWFDWRG